jgi:hypothetical protein
MCKVRRYTRRNDSSQVFQEKNIGMPIATTAPQPLPEAKKRLIGFGKRERHG